MAFTFAPNQQHVFAVTLGIGGHAAFSKPLVIAFHSLANLSHCRVGNIHLVVL